MKEKSVIRYSIDSILKKNGNVLVTGWAYDSISNTPVELSLLEDSSAGVAFKRMHRVDVNQKCKIEENVKIGFEIIFDMTWWKKKTKLKLTTANQSSYELVNLSLNREVDFTGNTLRSKISLNAKKVALGAKYFYNNGLKDTARRIKSEISYEFLEDYKKWIEANEKYDAEEVMESIDHFEKKPMISIILPVYNTEEKWLRKCIESVRRQYYTNWELCIADDNSSQNHVKQVLEEYKKTDSRIKVVYRDNNGHISESSNSALEIAEGEYVAFLDHDDILAPFALYQMVKEVNKHDEADIIYSDEDKINKFEKRSKPFFKPDWSPDTLMSQNYICHFLMIKRTLVEEVGGFRAGYEGAQDHDLVLRCTEKTKNIYHVPEVLYHWRMIDSSTARNPKAKTYAFDAGKKAVESALLRRNIKGTVTSGKMMGTYTVTYDIIGNPKVSILIPTKDHAKDLKICLESILKKTKYENFEIIIIDNGSKQEETFALFEHYKQILKERFIVLDLDVPFNYSFLNNEGVKKATGDYVLLLNNDIQILTDSWLEKMLGYAQQEHIGAVGAKLYYKDGTVQHSGVVIGLGGVAGHSHKYYSGKNTGYFNRLTIDSNYAGVTGACLLVEKNKFLAMEGLDAENLSIAFNDVDFCLKLIDSGYYNVCLTQVECIHYESKSRGKEDTKEKQERFEREIIFMKNKWGKYIMGDPFYNKNLTMDREDFSMNRNF
ncbi:glycosyltransferase [Eubacteriaceae bacterium ES3]|nr:glycosyltransferase [Eubacteriaceae bacterium ES3]